MNEKYPSGTHSSSSARILLATFALMTIPWGFGNRSPCVCTVYRQNFVIRKRSFDCAVNSKIHYIKKEESILSE